MGLTEGMATGYERHGFLIVHRHAGESFADVARRGNGVGVAIRPFRVDVN